MSPAPGPPVRSLLLFAVAVAGAALLGACGGGDEGERADATVAEPRLLQTETGERIFAGTLVNQGSSTIGIAEVEVALYDGQGSRIETMRIQVQDVSPGDSAAFNQTIDSNRPIQQAQVQSILSP
ncbi:FxLYD domain-containing protein [Salinibacter grassmerensis]|uniref:FxLYD domain-containing protein n=1 Tax=Salinibacter grassmerensis TaxID=3040353 RepID=UPI0021E6E4EA|nr:FxLYD domain-containing protein [Salinibacter grassmerensis]